MIFLGDFSFVRIFLKGYHVTMTTTLDTSCSENTMVLSARRGFLHACMYFLVLSLIVSCIYNMHDWSHTSLAKIVLKLLTSLIAIFHWTNFSINLYRIGTVQYIQCLLFTLVTVNCMFLGCFPPYNSI